MGPHLLHGERTEKVSSGKIAGKKGKREMECSERRLGCTDFSTIFSVPPVTEDPSRYISNNIEVFHPTPSDFPPPIYEQCQ